MVRSIGNRYVITSYSIHYTKLYDKICPDKYVVRSAESLYNEIKLYYDMGIKRFGFVDDLPNFNMKVV